MSEVEKIESAINVVTAIGTPEIEALISRTLFATGKNIRFRAFSQMELADFMESIELSSERWLVVASSDIAGFSEKAFHGFTSETVTCVLIDKTVNELNSESINDLISAKLRAPAAIRLPIRNQSRLISGIGITGTTGAPGRTTLAINLAAEMSLSKPTTLVDADLDNLAVDYALGLQDRNWRSDGKKTIKPQLNLIVDQGFSPAQVERTETYIVDCGSLGDINELRTDRRRKGFQQAQWIESCATLIYVAKADEHSIHQIERFNSQRRNLSARQEIIFVLNQVGNSRRYRELEKEFNNIASGTKFSLPMDSPSMERAKSQLAPLSEVAPRSNLRKKIIEVSRHLTS